MTYSQLLQAPLAKQKGQAGLVAISLTILTTLVILGASVASMSETNVRTNIASTQNLQSYYIAQAGIQEAIASRMLPRNNYMDFINTSNNPAFPMYPESGKVYFDAINKTGLMGMYRYMVLGGDPAANPANGLFELPRVDEEVSEQHFFIVSKGAVCADSQGNPMKDDIRINTTTIRPYCSTGTLQETLLMTDVDLSRTVNPNEDIVADYQKFEPATNLTSADVTLNTPVVVPGYPHTAPIAQFNFEKAWKHQDYTGSDALPVRISFHSWSDPKNERSEEITSADQALTMRAGERDMIRIHFKNGIDWRSLFQENPAACKADPLKCNVRLLELDAGRNPTGQMYGESTLLMNFTAANSNQALFMPPLDTEDGMAAGRWYRLVLDSRLRDFNNVPIGTTYNIDFQIQ